MVSVVVDQQKIFRIVHDFEPAPGPAESLQRGGTFLQLQSQFGTERQHRRGIEHIVLAGNIECHAGEFLVFAAERKGGGKTRAGDILAGIGSILAVGDRAWTSGADATRPGIVRAVKNFPLRLVEQLTESRIDGRQVGVVVEMFRFDVQNDGVFRMVADDRAIAFVPLGDKIFAAGIPARIRPENRDFGADIVRRMRAGGAKNVGRHGRDSRLAVHARDEDSLFSKHQSGECVGTAHHRFVQAFSRIEGGISFADRGGINDQLRIDHVLGTLRGAEIQTKRLQSLDLHGVDFVGTADLMPECEQQAGNPAHAGPCHADEMDPARRAMQKLCQFLRRHHFASVNTAATRAAASRGASVLAACDMLAKVSGDSSKDRSNLAKLSPVAPFSGRIRAAPAREKISAFNR